MGFRLLALRGALIAVLLLAAQQAFAAHPLVTDDAGTQGRGNFLLEINAEYTRDDEAATEETGGELAALFTAGITDTLDVVVGLPYAWSRVEDGGTVTSEEDGISDASLELKWRFFEREGLALALKPGLALPTGDEDEGLGNGEPSYSLTLIFTREFDSWALHANLGYARNEFALASDEEANRHDIWSASVAAEAGLSENLVAVGNMGVETNSDRASDTHPAFALAGLIWSVTESIDLDLGVKAGLTSTETDLAVLAGAAFSF